MKYILNNSQITDFALYKDYIFYSFLTEEQKVLIPDTIENPQFFYYLIENNQVIDYQKERKDFLLADNCKVATQEEIDKIEFNQLKPQIIQDLLDKYKQSKQDAILTAQGIKLNFAKDIDDAIDELTKRVAGGSLAGLEMLQTIDNLKLLLNKSIELRHRIRSNVATEQEVVAGKKTLKTLKEYKPILKVVFDEKIEILDLLK